MSTEKNMANEVYTAVLVTAGVVGVSMVSKKVLKEPFGTPENIKGFVKLALSDGFKEETKRHDLAMEKLAGEKEKYLEKLQARQDKLDELRNELADANKDIKSTNQSLELLRGVQELAGKTKPREPQLSDCYTPSPEMEEYMVMDWLLEVSVDEIVMVGKNAESMQELEKLVMKYVHRRIIRRQRPEHHCRECKSKKLIVLNGADTCTECGTSGMRNLSSYISYNHNKNDYLKKKSIESETMAGESGTTFDLKKNQHTNSIVGGVRPDEKNIFSTNSIKSGTMTGKQTMRRRAEDTEFIPLKGYAMRPQPKRPTREPPRDTGGSRTMETDTKT
ncbi:Hypothetical predicted protein [Paramuricea clavata]|uniref:Uncharacterized protein n=1 Tax=Paramuricea clavata TaxID=317549 RepID=A0A6S7HL71_PARCT|nr:Hypothetical predicted protein [Paramuricea clavata]